MIVYNLDKLIREELEINHRGKKYTVYEPTVETWGQIQKNLDKELSKGEIEGYKWLISVMVPDLLYKPFYRERTWKDKILRREVPQDNTTILDKALKSELRLMAQICLKVLSGRGAEGKHLAPEDIMTVK